MRQGPSINYVTLKAGEEVGLTVTKCDTWGRGV